MDNPDFHSFLKHHLFQKKKLSLRKKVHVLNQIVYGLS
jgi:hypothetical protein